MQLFAKVFYGRWFQTVGDTIVLVDIYDKSELDTMKEKEYKKILNDFLEVEGFRLSNSAL